MGRGGGFVMCSYSGRATPVRTAAQFRSSARCCRPTGTANHEPPARCQSQTTRYRRSTTSAPTGSASSAYFPQDQEASQPSTLSLPQLDWSGSTPVAGTEHEAKPLFQVRGIGRSHSLTLRAINHNSVLQLDQAALVIRRGSGYD